MRFEVSDHTPQVSVGLQISLTSCQFGELQLVSDFQCFYIVINLILLFLVVSYFSQKFIHFRICLGDFKRATEDLELRNFRHQTIQIIVQLGCHILDFDLHVLSVVIDLSLLIGHFVGERIQDGGCFVHVDIVVLREGAINLIQVSQPLAHILELVTILFFQFFSDPGDELFQLDQFLRVLWFFLDLFQGGLNILIKLGNTLVHLLICPFYDSFFIDVYLFPQRRL